MSKAQRWIFVVWAPHSRRSETLAQALGATLRNIHYLKYQSPLYAPPKYILQAVKTLKVLFEERPDVVFVQNPPFVCGLVVSLYCRLTGARFALDHHSDAFSHRWHWAQHILTRLACQAEVNIVTNQYWADIIESWDAHALVMGDPIMKLPGGESYPITSGFTIAFVQTFAADEPLEAVREAISRLPDVHLYITGNTGRVTQDYLDKWPQNVTFTGFLPDPQYIGLLRTVDAVMALTTRDHTLQSGGCEAVSVGKPLIVSDWPYLRQFFSKGTIYVSNSSEDICRGIYEMQLRHSELQPAVLSLYHDYQIEWQVKMTELKALLAS